MRAGERNNWIAQLRRYAQTAYSGTVQRPLSSPVSAPLVFRVERCMWIKVHEVQGLAKSGDSATALVVIDGHVVAQSEVMTSNSKSKIEATSHFFGSLPPIQRGVHVLVRHKEKEKQSHSSHNNHSNNHNNNHSNHNYNNHSNSSSNGGGLMGYCQIPIPMFEPGSTYNGWYPLSHGNVSEIDQQIGSYLPLATNVKPAWRRWTSKHPPAHSDSSAPSSSRPSTPFRSGDVHIQVRYDELVVLSSPFYVDIVTLLLDTRPTLIFDLISVLPRSADWLVETTTKIAICSNRVVAWIEAIVQHELALQAVPDPALIFRGASVATRAMDTLMKVTGLSFLDHMIGNVVRDVALGNYHCEVDPSRLHPKEDIDDHWRTLLHLQRVLWIGVEESIDRCPPTLSRVFGSIRAAIMQFYPDHSSHEQVRYSCISGFLFLRFVCPAMLSPKTFGLVGTQPNASALRTLTLLAKGIQCTANLTDFALKEPYMQPMNAFVQKSVPKLKHFIDFISSSPMDSMDVDSDGTRHTAPQIVIDEERMAIMTVDRERELAAFSDFLRRSRVDIREAIAPISRSTSGAGTATQLRTQASSSPAASAHLAHSSSLSSMDETASGANHKDAIAHSGGNNNADAGASASSPSRGGNASDSAFAPQTETLGRTMQSAHSTAMDADNSCDDVSMDCSESQNAQNTDMSKATSSTSLAETARLIDGLVQACELVQECVDACMQSPYAAVIQTPSPCSKDHSAI
ncbi:GTPase activating factor [Coemansia erecta]|nr:GTPase activating factor [Coemansia erecta]KAJ2879978.1 GTPase activating factor [Coemansia asiatica]